MVILFVTRAIPFLHWGEAPLGYDTGIYLKQFGDYFNQIKNTGLIANIYPITFITNLLYLFGWKASQLISAFYIILNIFVGLGIYIVAKEYFNKNVAFLSLLVFSLSASQFLAYWWMYFGMVIATLFTLVSFYLLKKRSWLVAPVAGFMGAAHPLSFLSIGFSIILYFVFNKYSK